MSHALDAHKKRARSIVASDTSSSCGTITVVDPDDNGDDDTGTGNGDDDTDTGNGDDDTDTGNGDDEPVFLEENGLWIAAGAVGVGLAAVFGRR